MRLPCRSTGFVLIYTLWIVAAVSILLALYAKSASQPARMSEQQFKAAIELPETLNLLDYVLAHTIAQEREIDPRFITYRQEIRGESIQDGRSLIRELKEILGQIGMEIDIPDDSQTGIEVITKDEKPSGQAPSETTKVRQGRIFGAGKDKRTIRIGDATYQVRVLPVNARPSLNTLMGVSMTDYLVHLGLSESAARQLTATIKDWRDQDNFVSDDGAESGHYAFQRGPRNAPIQTWDEVYYLKGANAQLVEFLRRHFTLYGQGGRVHAEYLSPEALAAMTELEPWEVKVALENHALRGEDQVPLSELLGDEEARRFNSLVGWDSDTRILLVDVFGSQTRISAAFDTANQQLLDWYLWH
jgi:hypothetical protein